jgi:hypothetical protein
MPMISYRLTCRTCGPLARVRLRAEADRLVEEHEREHPEEHHVTVERAEVVRT